MSGGAQVQPTSPDTRVPPAAAEKAPPCTMVIFGAHGDLTKRLLIPALYNLVGSHLLDDGFKLVGVDRVDSTDDGWRDELRATMNDFTKDPTAEFYTPKIDDDAWGWLASRTSYFKADFTNDGDMEKLKATIAGNAVFYCAVAARFFAVVAGQLGKLGLLKQEENAFRRLVVEKPFGSDLDKLEEAERRPARGRRREPDLPDRPFPGEETVQNILAFRFGNGIFEPVWRREYIDHIQVTAAETVGVEQRGAFYEPTGALRDMVPNHLFTLLSMVTTEPPNSFDAESVRSMKQAFFESLRPVKPENVVRGQYTAGSVRGRDVPGYRQKPGRLRRRAITETYVAMKLEADNWRWAGVPFYLRTGKCMTGRRTEVVVHFKQAPYAMFRDTPVDRLAPNNLSINIQPKQGITLGISARCRSEDGSRRRLDGVPLRGRLQAEPNVGYETLIYDCLVGDATLFQRADNIDAAWAVVDPALQSWRRPNRHRISTRRAAPARRAPTSCLVGTAAPGVRSTRSEDPGRPVRRRRGRGLPSSTGPKRSTSASTRSISSSRTLTLITTPPRASARW